MSGAVFVRTLQLQHDLPGVITFEPFVGDGRPGDIAAEMLEFCTLIGAPAHRRMQAKAVRVNTQLWGRCLSCARQALQAQHFLSGAWAEGDTLSARGSLQRLERPIGVGFGEVVPMRAPRRVNRRMVRVMIFSSTASSSSVEGAAASWKSGTPSRFR